MKILKSIISSFLDNENKVYFLLSFGVEFFLFLIKLNDNTILKPSFGKLKLLLLYKINPLFR